MPYNLAHNLSQCICYVTSKSEIFIFSALHKPKYRITSCAKYSNILTENGLTYCTHASGFSLNPQTADAGTSMNVVTEQIYNKLFDIKKSQCNINTNAGTILFHLS